MSRFSFWRKAGCLFCAEGGKLPESFRTFVVPKELNMFGKENLIKAVETAMQENPYLDSMELAEYAFKLGLRVGRSKTPTVFDEEVSNPLKTNYDGNPSKENIDPDLYYVVTVGSSYVLTLKLKGEVILQGYHPGACDDDIDRIMELPEVKSQLDAISDAELNDWWEEVFLDGMPKTPVSENRHQALSWLIFECCSMSIDGYWDSADYE